MLKSQELTAEEEKKTPEERHREMYDKYKKYGYPKSLMPQQVNTRKLPQGKACGDCWHFSHGRVCGPTGQRNTQVGVDYCQYQLNHFTEAPELITITITEENQNRLSDSGVVFVGNKDELLLHELLVRAKYQCECKGVMCSLHKGRCGTLHKAAGGSTVLLMQPRNFKKANSLENSEVMCVACCSANTITKMSVPKKKKKMQENPNQTTII